MYKAIVTIQIFSFKTHKKYGYLRSKTIKLYFFSKKLKNIVTMQKFLAKNTQIL